MAIQPPAKISSVAPSDFGIDGRRRALWLQSPYSNAVWTVSDTRDPTRTKIIDFRYRLADGRLLTDAERLYATVKEYAWWIRDARYSRIDDAQAHLSMVRNMLHFAHALTIRKLNSFSHLQPFDVEQLVEDCRYGTDTVLRASDRLEEYFAQLAATEECSSKPFGGLPRYVAPGGQTSNFLHAEVILAACNLPASASKLPRIANLLGRAALANGLSPRSGLRAGLQPLQNLTVQALQRWLDPLEQLYAMRRRIEAEAIQFKPFALGAARVAAVKGVGTHRTPTPPPRLALHLLEHSVRWIFDKAPAIAAGMLDRTAILHLATACWIVIAAFSARRDEEIDDLRVGCLQGDDASGWWLEVYIEKTLQRKEWIPVPNMVARAVQTLERISEAARHQTGSDHLFQWLTPYGTPLPIDIGRRLDSFAALVGVPDHTPRGKSPEAWHWHPHQFRRFFAILYFYRFESGSIEVLSHHLRHFSLEMTRRYVTEDPDVAALWTDTEWGYMGHVARSIVAGERAVSGSMGERLKRATKRLADMFRRTLQVVSPERVGAGLALIMQRQGLVLTPKPWVTCSCPRSKDAAARAACRRRKPHVPLAVGPDFAQAGPSVCSICPFAMIEGERAPFVDTEIWHLESATASKSRTGTILGALEKARLVELRDARDTKYAKAKPLEGVALDGAEAQ